jgi:chitinase
MKPLKLLFVILLTSTFCAAKPKPIIVAYVTSWTTVVPNPRYVTHINYAFGHVNDTFDGIRIDNTGRLKSIVELKRDFPKLKVLLSIGGWGSGKFSEMAATIQNRKKFAEDCLRVIREFNLDGVDIDWEYPTSDAAKISNSIDDTKNYSLMLKDIRNQIGTSKLLTLASSAEAKYIDFKALSSTVDFVNIMAYDMANPPYHHAGLYRSEFTSGLSVDEAVTAHVKAGIPIGKLVLGIPFYGHGRNGVASYIDYREIVNLNAFELKWDDKAKAAYLENDKGDFVLTYETPQSIDVKCKYLMKKGMLGAMYWDYGADTDQGILRKAVFSGLQK